MSDLRSRIVCERVRAQLSLQLDGRLSELEEAMVAAHVARCPSCDAYRSDVAAVTSLLRTSPLEKPAQAIVLPRRPRVSLGLVRAGAAAALVTLAIGLTGMAELLRTEESGGLASRIEVPPYASLDRTDELEPIRSTRRFERRATAKSHQRPV